MMGLIWKTGLWCITTLAALSVIFVIGCQSFYRQVPDSAEKVSPLGVGDSAPLLSLRDQEGEEVALGQLFRENPLIMVFYRGGWCPYCNIQLASLGKIERKLVDLGYRIIAVSPDKPAKLAESSVGNNFSYTLLSDSDAWAAKAFGIAFRVDEGTLEKYKGYGIDLAAASGMRHNILPVPAVFIIGTDGVIRFAHVNPDYRERLSSEKLLTAASAIVNRKESK